MKSYFTVHSCFNCVSTSSQYLKSDKLLHLRNEKQASQADCQSFQHGVVELAIHFEKKRAQRALKLLDMKEAAETVCVGPCTATA